MQLSPLKRGLLLVSLFAGTLAVHAIDPIYINSGAVTNPIVNAYQFLNEGYFATQNGSFSPLPYETSNTTNFLNRGTISGYPGYRFHTFLSNGTRKRAATFTNEGIIDAMNNGFVFINQTEFGSYINVNATNVVNEGVISVSQNGLLRIDGNRVNLRGGGLQAADSESVFFDFDFNESIFSTNYFLPNRVSDYYWGVGTNNVIKGNGPALDLASGRFDPTSFNFGSGDHHTINVNGFTNNFTRVPRFGTSGSSFSAYAFTNEVTSSNRIVQVVFVSANVLDPGMSVSVRFAPNGQGELGHKAIVQFSAVDTDAITGLPVTREAYFTDNSIYATYGTNTLFYQEAFNASTERPNPFDVMLSAPSGWLFGENPNTAFNTALLYNPVIHANRFVTNLYAGYSAFIGNAANTNFTGSDLQLDPTNSLGRIEIFADQLDINSARMRSEGLLTLKTDNFASVTNGARLDAQELNLNLTSTNQTFIISNVLSGTVVRIGGSLNAYSCVWSNQTQTGGEDRFHVLILENLLTAAQPSTSYGFIARVTNQPNSSIIIHDDVTVARNFFLDAENITIRGDLTLPASIGYTNMPRVLNFTNEGSISIPSLTAFTRQTGPYTSFVNTNTISAGAQAFNASYFGNSGLLQASVGSIGITNTGGIANLSNGFLMASTDIRLFTQTIQASNSLIWAGSVTTNFNGQAIFSIGSINLTVGSGFVDGGSNSWQSFNGVHLLKSSPGSWEGDLLGTKITSYARPFSTTRHTWTAADYGADRRGYTNNAAVRILTLDGYNSGRFRFSAPTAEGESAIYVDYLDLKNNATNYTTALEIDSNFKVYFADASLPPGKLDGSHGGRLRWVQNYAGPTTSTNVVLSDGRTITVNRALVESSDIDSDGDGTPNRFDTQPFDGPSISSSIVNLPPLSTVLSWNGAANTTYTVDYTTNLVSWHELTSVTTGSSAGTVSVSDPVSPETPRFYRVRYSP